MNRLLFIKPPGRCVVCGAITDGGPVCAKCWIWGDETREVIS